jgi:hypothetical protein
MVLSLVIVGSNVVQLEQIPTLWRKIVSSFRVEDGDDMFLRKIGMSPSKNRNPHWKMKFSQEVYYRRMFCAII